MNVPILTQPSCTCKLFQFRYHRIMKNTHQDLAKSLQLQGFRMTQLRRKLLKLFSVTRTPLSVPEIDEALTKQKLEVNKTTIYRELEFLLGQEVIHSVQFNDDKKRYELAREHHHHLICEKCQNIVEITIEELEPTFPKIEARLKETKGFTLVDHSLEFFGVCKNCS